MYVHSPDVSGIFITPYNIQQVFAAVHFVGIRHQKLQNVKFLGGEIDLPSGNKDAAAFTIQPQIS